MNQRINLLPPKPKVQRDWLNFSSVLPAFLLLLVVCGAITGWLWYSTEQKQSSLESRQAKLQKEEAQVKELQTRLDERQPDNELQAELAQARRTLEVKRQLAELLRGVQPENREPFSEGLYSLSDHIPDKTWLTSFTIGRSLSSLEINGASSEAAKIPLYLRNLAGSGAFNAMRFGQLETERDDNDRFQFTVVGNDGGRNE